MWRICTLAELSPTLRGLVQRGVFEHWPSFRLLPPTLTELSPTPPEVRTRNHRAATLES